MPTTANNPFMLDNQKAFLTWCEDKLSGYPESLEDLTVEISDPGHLTTSERQALLMRCNKSNLAIYSVSKNNKIIDKNSIAQLGIQCGLSRLDHNPGADTDAITALTVQADNYHREYIPYTDKAIAWHTDGYYNLTHKQVHAMILHCVQPASNGGSNQLLDHELVYMQLRQQNIGYIKALMHPEAMTIPANVVDGKLVRAASVGPVFSVNSAGNLHMRYTDRTRSVIWRNDELTQAAVLALKELLGTLNHWTFTARLGPGQGVIANNVLHTRSKFIDTVDKPRLLYRARYYDRIINL
ncbi:taurine catabolism dioxygenase TauD [Achromatium sp. WMS2]|nr:taurine catabolism dioxygenase TauD [Achromatium sp. WMS2]